MYLAGLGAYGFANRGGVASLVAELRAAGTDVEALAAALRADRHGIAPPAEFVLAGASGDGAVGALLVAGTLLLPAVFFVVIRVTRRYYAWQPTYLYVAAVAAPAAAIVASAALGALPLYVDALAFVVAPLAAIGALLGRRVL